MVLVQHFLAIDYNTKYVPNHFNNNGNTISYYIGLAKNGQSIGVHDSYNYYNIKYTSGQNIFVFDAEIGDIIKPYFTCSGESYTHDLWTPPSNAHIIPRNKMTMIRIR